MPIIIFSSFIHQNFVYKTSNCFLQLIKCCTFSITHSIWCLVVWILIQCSSSKTTSKYLYKIKSESGTNLSQCLTIINNLIIVNNSNQTGGIMIMCVLNISIAGIHTGGNLGFSHPPPPQILICFHDLVMYNIIYSEPNHFVFSSIHLMKN